MLLDIPYIIFDQLRSELLTRKNIALTIARLDKIHPVVSGNKLFKLHYFFESFYSGKFRSIKTFGGAYSNHLVATAFACQKLHIPCQGIVRGEKPTSLSPTLEQCLEYGMELSFVSREAYAALSGNSASEAELLVIPEGGYHPLGAAGASLIMDAIPENNYTHIYLPVGTATTLAGILRKSAEDQIVCAVPVLKGLNDLPQRVKKLNAGLAYATPSVIDQYHFGGYARSSQVLLDFMNAFYTNYAVPTDFVYTGKMMYAVMDAINRNEFTPGTRILCLHTGGLQGNVSLPKGSLIF